MDEIRLVIAGCIRSGKSSLSAYAEKKYHMVPFAFGDKLKDDFHKEYPHVPRYPKPRKGYQLFGQLKRYVYGDDYWVDLCFKEIDRIRQAANYYNSTGSEIAFSPIITDARQPNEFERCRKEGYKIIKVVAPLELRMERARAAGDKFKEEDFYHETELYIANLEADYTIHNDEGLDKLYRAFDSIIEDIRNGEIK